MTGKVDTYNLLRFKALHSLIRLRAECIDEAEFGRKAAPVIDMLVADLEAIGKPRSGAWSDAERQVLRDAYASCGRDAAYVAATKINRTASQIQSMAGNLGLK